MPSDVTCDKSNYPIGHRSTHGNWISSHHSVMRFRQKTYKPLYSLTTTSNLRQIKKKCLVYSDRCTCLTASKPCDESFISVMKTKNPRVESGSRLMGIAIFRALASGGNTKLFLPVFRWKMFWRNNIIDPFGIGAQSGNTPNTLQNISTRWTFVTC